MEEITDKLEFIKIKNLCSVKDSVKRMRRQATDWEKTFVKDTSDKELLSKIYRKLLKLNNKKTTQKTSKKRVELTSHQRRYTGANKHIKRCSTLCH